MVLQLWINPRKSAKIIFLAWLYSVVHAAVSHLVLSVRRIPGFF